MELKLFIGLMLAFVLLTGLVAAELMASSTDSQQVNAIDLSKTVKKIKRVFTFKNADASKLTAYAAKYSAIAANTE